MVLEENLVNKAKAIENRRRRISVVSKENRDS